MADRMVAPLSGEFTVLNLGAVVAMLEPALQTVIEKLAAAQADESSAWFDELEKELLLGAKNTVSEGISIEVEAEGLKLGVDMLQATLDRCRENLDLHRNG